MADLATLKIVVDASNAVRAVDQFGRAVDSASLKTQKAREEIEKTSDALQGTGKAAQDAAEEIRDGAESIGVAGHTIATALGVAAVTLVVNYFARLIEESQKSREEAERLAEQWETTMRRLVNAGDVARLQKLAQDIYLGTPFENFADGIVAAQREVDRLRQLRDSDPLGALSNIFNPDQLQEAEERLKALVDRFDEIRQRILGIQGLRPFEYGPTPITITGERGDPMPSLAAITESLRALSTASQQASERVRSLSATIRGPFAGLDGLGVRTGPGAPPPIADAARARTFAQQQALAAAREQIRLNEELARNFRENLQRTVGDFFTEFLREGRISIRDLFGQLSNVGASLLGQTLSRALTERLGNLTFGQSLGAGAGLLIGGGILESLLGLRDAANQVREAMAASARAIEEFARYATDSQLSPLDRELQRLARQRDDLARQAVGASGISGFTGGLSEAIAAAQTFFNLTGNTRYRDLLDQLRELERAFGANSEAAQQAARAERALIAARQIEGLESFRNSLLLGNQSILNPGEQLAEARRQYDLILALARGGDASAIASLPETARALLDASRAVNASGVRYAEDFRRVTADTEALIDAIRNRPEPIDGIIDRIDPYFAESTELMRAQVAVQQEGFSLLVGRLDSAIDRLDALERTTRLGLDELAGT